MGVRIATIGVSRALSPEDQARADCYAVIARLFAAPPDREFLTALRDAPRLPHDDGVALAAAWNRLLDASGAMDADAARQEYDDLFIGVGRSEVNLHGSHWRSGFMMEKPLAELRTELALLGLARKGETTMVEDHISALCETMRLLIAGDVERRSADLDVQRNFFQKQLLPWVFDCCAAIRQSTLANYYRRVAEFVEMFMAVERDSLAMD
ncbi:MAG TPA: molecular chaperone TorD family protein [Casimicrobiaceae bacterium]|nr:molecular chaperone TorD family protein [Casimicrobiaceae bacterium]